MSKNTDLETNDVEELVQITRDCAVALEKAENIFFDVLIAEIENCVNKGLI